MPHRNTPIYQMPAGDSAAGYFSKELLNRIIIGMERMGRTMGTLLISPEDMADIREWTNADDIDEEINEQGRKQLFEAAGVGSTWSFQIKSTELLGVRGKYNINGYESEWGVFKASDNNEFNSYRITNKNILDSNGNLIHAGETQVYAFARDITKSLKMPVDPYKLFWDPTLHRKQKYGCYGWQNMGMAILLPSYLAAGIIDRY